MFSCFLVFFFPNISLPRLRASRILFRPIRGTPPSVGRCSARVETNLNYSLFFFPSAAVVRSSYLRICIPFRSRSFNRRIKYDKGWGKKKKNYKKPHSRKIRRLSIDPPPFHRTPESRTFITRKLNKHDKTPGSAYNLSSGRRSITPIVFIGVDKYTGAGSVSSALYYRRLRHVHLS